MLNASGEILQYAGRPDAWTIIGRNPGNLDLRAGGRHLFAHNESGEIFLYRGSPHSWDLIASNLRNKVVVAGDEGVWVMQWDGSIYEYGGTAHDWRLVDDHKLNDSMACCRGNLYVMRANGDVVEFSPRVGGQLPSGPIPSTSGRIIASSGHNTDIVSAGGSLYVFRSERGTAWEYQGAPHAWRMVASNRENAVLFGGGISPVILQSDGEIYQYQGTPNAWAAIGSNAKNFYPALNLKGRTLSAPVEDAAIAAVRQAAQSNARDLSVSHPRAFDGAAAFANLIDLAARPHMSTERGRLARDAAAHGERMAYALQAPKQVQERVARALGQKVVNASVETIYVKPGFGPHEREAIAVPPGGSYSAYNADGFCATHLRRGSVFKLSVFGAVVHDSGVELTLFGVPLEPIPSLLNAPLSILGKHARWLSVVPGQGWQQLFDRCAEQPAAATPAGTRDSSADDDGGGDVDSGANGPGGVDLPDNDDSGPNVGDDTRGSDDGVGGDVGDDSGGGDVINLPPIDVFGGD